MDFHTVSGQVFSMSNNGLVVPTVPMRRRMPSPPPAIGQSAKMESISFCAAIHWSRGSARAAAGAKAATAATAAAPRSRRPSKVLFCGCGARIDRSAALAVKVRVRSGTRIMFQVGCAPISGAKGKKELTTCKISVSMTLAPSSRKKHPLTKAHRCLCALQCRLATSHNARSDCAAAPVR